MYCVKCGVELADSEKTCPLCGTAAFHPELPRQSGEMPYPPDKQGMPDTVNRSGTLFITTVLFALPTVTLLLCDWRINNALVWSGYAAGALIMLYVIIVLPLWFRAANPVIFVPADFAVVALYLLYVDYATGGHWFLTFALPVTGGAAILVCAVIALVRYVHKGYLYIFGGASILAGMLTMLVEYLINLTFGIHEIFFWSFFPMAAGLILGLILIVIAICRPLRESLHKKFFF